MRDKMRNKDYFEKYIEEEEQGIVFFETRLADGTVNEERVAPVKKEVHRLKYNILIAKYSMGEPIDKLREEYVTLLGDAPQFWTQDTYDFNVNFIGLAVLFNCEELIPAVIREYMEEKSDLDWVIAALSETESKPPLEDIPLLFPTEFDELKSAIAMKSEEAVAKYIENDWYKLHKDCGWYDSHKSKQNTYKGYWCFEVSALVKKYGIDDESFKDYDYYPCDLVHFYN